MRERGLEMENDDRMCVRVHVCVFVCVCVYVCVCVRACVHACVDKGMGNVDRVRKEISYIIKYIMFGEYIKKNKGGEIMERKLKRRGKENEKKKREGKKQGEKLYI